MSGAAFADSLLLVIALAGLGLGAHRLAAPLSPERLPRLLASVVLLAAGAVLDALVLGLFGLGGSPGALTGLAVAAGLVIWLATGLRPRAGADDRPPRAGGSTSLHRGEANRPTPLGGTARTGTSAHITPLVLITAGAVLGALLAVAALQLQRPILGQDAVTYHLPEVVGFVQSGHPGRVFSDFYGLPVGNYPITEEVLLAFVTGITHGFGALLLTTLATVPLLLLAGWLGLAELGVPAPVRILALAALALVPLITQAWVEPGTDLEAMTWLVSCAALCVTARRHPGLLAPALVAGGLAIGTKTTVATWIVVLLVVTLWFQRGALAPRWRSLLAGLLCAVAVGLIWYLRNWVQHGSPLWPFSSFPGNDPRPEIIDYLSTSLLKSLHHTLLEHLHPYASALSGGVVVILGGILCGVPGLLTRRPRIAVAALVVLLGALEYSVGPVTGLPPGNTPLVGVVGSTLRYLMPVFAAGALALALCAADRAPVLRALGLLGLVGAIVWDLVSDVEAKFSLAHDDWLWMGIVLGALAGAVLAALRTRAPRPNAAGPATPGPVPSGSTPGTSLAAPLTATLTIAAALALAIVIALGSTHFAARHAATHDYAADLGAFLETQPGYADSDVAVATARTGLAPLAGDRLQHPLSVIPQHASCAQVAALHRRDYLVVAIPPPDDRSGLLARLAPSGSVVRCILAARDIPVYDDGQYVVYAP